MKGISRNSFTQWRTNSTPCWVFRLWKRMIVSFAGLISQWLPAVLFWVTRTSALGECRGSSHLTLKKKKKRHFCSLSTNHYDQKLTLWFYASLSNCNDNLLYYVDSKHFFILSNPCCLQLGWRLKSRCTYNRVNTVFHDDYRLFSGPLNSHCWLEKSTTFQELLAYVNTNCKGFLGERSRWCVYISSIQ